MCYTKDMSAILLAVIAVGAFVVLGIMAILLRLSSVRDERDPITQEIIVRANSSTGSIVINAPVTQEDDD